MKRILIILLFLSSVCNAQDRDSIIYTQFRYEFMNAEIARIDNMRINFDNPTIKPALILGGVFLINHFIIMHDEKRGDFSSTTKKTGTVFLIGGTLSILTFALEIKKHKRSRKIRCLTIN